MAGYKKSNPAAWGVTVGLWCVTGLIMLAMGLMELGAIHHDLYCPDYRSRGAEVS